MHFYIITYHSIKEYSGDRMKYLKHKISIYSLVALWWMHILFLLSVGGTIQTRILSAVSQGHIPKEYKEEEMQETMKQENEKKMVALTFDDGPSEIYTPILLEGLKKRGVKAAFFLIGESAKKNPGLVQQMVKDGHVVGNHTYTHVQLNGMSVENAMKEITDANEVLENITGRQVVYIRPPFGAFDEELDEKCDMIQVLWDVDPLDWKCQNCDTVVKRVVENVEENDIILLHDIYSTSVEAAFHIIDILQQQGYEFVTLDELLL